MLVFGMDDTFDLEKFLPDDKDIEEAIFIEVAATMADETYGYVWYVDGEIGSYPSSLLPMIKSQMRGRLIAEYDPEDKKGFVQQIPKLTNSGTSYTTIGVIGE